MLAAVAFVLFLQVLATTVSSPTICDVEETMVIDSGGNLSLVCVGDGDLKWEWPVFEGAEFSVNTTVVDTKDSPCAALSNDITNRFNRRHVSYITVQETSYLATGYFTCIDAANASARVYVFVRDPVHFLVDSNEFVEVRQYENAIIPCRPTSPDLIVTLTSDNGVMDFAPGDYDPKIGFKLYNLTLQDRSHLFCSAKKTEDDEEGEEIYFDLNVHTSETNKFVLKPHISPKSDQSVEVGYDAQLICLLEVDEHVAHNHFSLTWTGPNSLVNSSSMAQEKGEKTGLLNWKSLLVLRNVTKKDAGVYTCEFVDHGTNERKSVSQNLQVHYANESFINLTLETDIVEVQSGEKVARWTGMMTAHPSATLSWITPHGLDTKQDGTKYVIKQNGTRISLEVLNPTIGDAGVYTLLAHNMESVSRTMTLKVHASPQIDVDRYHLYPYGEEVKISCKVTGYPTPSIEWFEKQCDQLDEEDCDNAEEVSIQPRDGLISELVMNESHIVSNILWKMNFSGALICKANNSKGQEQKEIPLKVTDVPNEFKINAPEENVVGDIVTIHCAVATYQYSGPIEWSFRSSLEDTPQGLKDDPDATIISYEGFYSLHSNVTFMANKSNSGEYICKVKHLRPEDNEEGKEWEEWSLNITVLDPQSPVLLKTNLNKTEVEMSSWQPIEWFCYVEGVPSPTITWLKDGWPVSFLNDSSIELRENNQTLLIKSITSKDEGQYECHASNREGTVSSFVFLRLKERTPFGLVVSVVVVALLLVAVLILLCIRIYRERQRKKELSLAGLLDFRQGGVDNINPELTLDEQANLLPYDSKWEFPRKQLHLGKQLGAGAFGVVLKAEAEGIVPNEARTTVAVKMVKRHSDAALVRALAGELKIMAHLGRHANVVNLLGACTSQLAKRELLVIVEFCKFGNVHNYLLSHRSQFLDQIDRLTGKIDVTKGRFIRDERNRLHYAQLQFARSVESAQFSGASHDTESTVVSAHSPGEESSLITTPVGGDYVFSERETLSTSVLVAWAFQIAQGMEYLASRRVLHGDLAARNILLAEGNVVKICDFGLARSMYEDFEYRKAGKSLLPVKWLAIESIQDRIFSTQSDVWSFGVVLWELFSLARTPYPGISSFEDVLGKLLAGYRLQQPDYSTKELYNIMLECWNAEPGKRPSFTDLACKLGALMEDSSREHYKKLNDQYVSAGEDMPNEDYLAMVRSPTYDGSSSPRYVNIPSKESPGYLDMTATSWSSDGEAYEMKPMLGRTPSDAENGDYLIPRETPFSSAAVSNPSYHLRLSVSTEDSGKGNTTDQPAAETKVEPSPKNLYGRISKNVGESEDLSSFNRYPVKEQISFFESFRKKDGGRKTKEGPK